jgi:outer membrane protein TolC
LALYGAGRLSFLDVQRSLQNQLNAENSLIDAVNQYQNQVDDFKVTLGMPVGGDLEITPIELQVNPPDLEHGDPEQAAVKYRLDLQTARDQIDDARRGVSNAKNGLLPNVTLNASAATGSGLEPSWYQFNNDATVYGGGVRIDWPLDQLAERNAYRRSLIHLERSQRNYVQVRDTAISDVRSIARAIRVALATLQIQQRSVELNQKRLDLANELLLQGKKGVLDVVDAQSALLNAQDAYDQARASLQTRVLQYLRDTGTLRIDPQAGTLGRAMDRAGDFQRDAQLFDKIEKKLDLLEKQ